MNHNTFTLTDNLLLARNETFFATEL